MDVTNESRLDRAGAWVVLAVTLALAATLWILGTRPTTQEERVFGGGTGTFAPTDIHTNWVLVGAAIVIGIVGCGVWAALLLRRPRTATLTAVVAVVCCGAIAAGLLGVLSRVRADDPDPAVGFRYESVQAVVDALSDSTVACTRVSTEPAPASYFRGEQGKCEVDRRLAPDGFETVLIQFWRSPDARREWYEEVPASDVVSVDGPTWLITCRFETTCTQIQIATGGRTR